MDTVTHSPEAIRLHLPPALSASPDELFRQFCAANRDLHFERNHRGEWIVMQPAGGETGGRNLGLGAQLWNWARRDGTGQGFDSSTGFVLPTGQTYSPDAAWVLKSRLALLTLEQKRSFLPLCPDFVVELRSPSDRLQPLQEKMSEYVAAGARLGWLIDPIDGNRVFVYRSGEPVETLDKPRTVSGDPVLPSFVLELDEIWMPGF